MKVTGNIVEKVQENWWVIVTDSKTQLMNSDQKLNEGVTYTFINPQEMEKDIWKANLQLKPLKSKGTIENNVEEKKKNQLLKIMIELTSEEKVMAKKEDLKMFKDIFET